jgi:hypothetical protein
VGTNAALLASVKMAFRLFEANLFNFVLEGSIAKAGIWGGCIRERKPVIINNYGSDVRPTKHGTVLPQTKGLGKLVLHFC